jgi:hypothetical protein
MTSTTIPLWEYTQVSGNMSYPKLDKDIVWTSRENLELRSRVTNWR